MQEVRLFDAGLQLVSAYSNEWGDLEVKWIAKSETGDNTGNYFETLYLGHLWSDFDGVWYSVNNMASSHATQYNNGNGR